MYHRVEHMSSLHTSAVSVSMLCSTAQKRAIKIAREVE